MKTFLVVNPGSANGQTGRRWPEMAAKISARLGEFRHAFTERAMHANALARRAIEDGYDCIVAVGGDGTINEVVNGFFQDGRPIRPGVSLGVVPRGTGGDFRKTFDWDVELESALARIARGTTCALDVGRVTFVDHEGHPRDRYFVNVCSFGVSGLVDREVNRSSKALGGKLTFMLGSVKALLKYQDRPVQVSFDGGAFERISVTTLSVANGRFFGGGMKVAPDADPCDGKFDVVIWSGYGLSDFALKSKAIYDGSHVKMQGTRVLRATRIEARSEQEVLLDVDGEQPGRLPCEITMLPGALPLRV